MCGICGVVVGQGVPDTSRLELMTSRLAHRGPDAQGIWMDGPAGIGHRRLSIIDIEASTQPMEEESGRYVIAFNGEIYNYLELRRELESQGVCFRTSGDTEVLLKGLALQWTGFLGRVNGMFAFALWDIVEKRLLLARDRMGVKPIYYGRGPGGSLYFASELQALRGMPLDFSLDSDAMGRYLVSGFIPSPHTVFKGVKELRPAHYLEWSLGKERVERYWSLPGIDHDLCRSGEKELCERLVSLLKSSVEIRLRSDVPLGAFLSGGLDSSIIVWAMKELEVTDLHTFSIGFDQDDFDESAFASEVAAMFGTRHHGFSATLSPLELLTPLVAHYGQPYGDSSSIPTWRLSDLTRREVTVALSGDGGDELFCGYQRYRAARLLGLYRRLPSALRGELLAPLARSLPEGTGYYGKSLKKKIKLFCELDQRIDHHRWDIHAGFFTCSEAEALLGSGTLDWTKWANEAQGPWADLVEAMVRHDLLHYLPDDILVKVDRASMAHALEVRSPFLDVRLVEFAASLPMEFKLRGHETKYILRRAFDHRLPSSSLTRAKHGFAVPVGEWFKAGLGLALEEMVDNGVLVDGKMVRRLLGEHRVCRRDNGHRLWLILFLEHWQRWWRSNS